MACFSTSKFLFSFQCHILDLLMFFPLSKTISDTVMLLQLRAHTISKAGFASLASCPAGLLCDLPGAGGHVLRPVNPVVKDRL